MDEGWVQGANLCIVDADKDKKDITQMKKGKNPPIIANMHLIFEGILSQKLDIKKHSIVW